MNEHALRLQLDRGLDRLSGGASLERVTHESDPVLQPFLAWFAALREAVDEPRREFRDNLRVRLLSGRPAAKHDGISANLRRVAAAGGAAILFGSAVSPALAHDFVEEVRRTFGEPTGEFIREFLGAGRDNDDPSGGTETAPPVHSEPHPLNRTTPVIERIGDSSGQGNAAPVVLDAATIAHSSPTVPGAIEADPDAPAAAPHRDPVAGGATADDDRPARADASGPARNSSPSGSESTSPSEAAGGSAAPNAAGANPDAAGGNPKAGGGNPNAAGGNPKAGGGNPNAAGGNPKAAGGNPNAAGGNPKAAGGNPNSGGGNPNAAGGNPNAGGANPKEGGGNPNALANNQTVEGNPNQATAAPDTGKRPAKESAISKSTKQ